MTNKVVYKTLKFSYAEKKIFGEIFKINDKNFLVLIWTTKKVLIKPKVIKDEMKFNSNIFTKYFPFLKNV